LQGLGFLQTLKPCSCLIPPQKKDQLFKNPQRGAERGLRVLHDVGML
jgi:hypothetical protein